MGQDFNDPASEATTSQDWDGPSRWVARCFALPRAALWLPNIGRGGQPAATPTSTSSATASRGRAALARLHRASPDRSLPAGRGHARRSCRPGSPGARSRPESTPRTRSGSDQMLTSCTPWCRRGSEVVVAVHGNAGRREHLICSGLLSRGRGEAPPGWVPGGASFLVALARGVRLGERVVVDGVVSLIFAGWVPQDGVSAGALTRV